MSTIKINELATTEISLTDFFAKADVNGLMTKNTIQGLSNILDVASGSVFRGSLGITDTPSLDGWYFASESGTYTNAGGLVVDITNQLVIIIVSDTQTTFSKVDIPLTISFDTIPTEGSTNAVESGGLLSFLNNNFTKNIGLNGLAIANDFSENIDNFNSFNGGVVTHDVDRLKCVVSADTKGVAIDPSNIEDGKQYLIYIDIDLNDINSINFYNKWSNLIQEITESGLQYLTTFTADNTGSFPYPIFSATSAGTFYIDNIIILELSDMVFYADKDSLDTIEEELPTLVYYTDFNSLPNYISSFNGGVISIDANRLSCVVTGADKGFEIDNLVTDEVYLMEFTIDLNDVDSVKFNNYWQNSIYEITESGDYSIRFINSDGVSFSDPIFSATSAGTFYLDNLKVRKEVDWYSYGEAERLIEKTDISGGNDDGRVQIGINAVADNADSIAIGENSYSKSVDCVSLGENARASFSADYDSTAVDGGSNMSLGCDSSALSWRAIAVGAKSIAGSTSTVVVGYGSFVAISHGVCIGRGTYLPNNAPVNSNTALIGGDGCNDIYINNGWGHEFDVLPTGISIQNITPSSVTKRYHGQDAYDSKETPTDFNVQGGNVSLASGAGTGSADGGDVLFETAPSTGLKGSNEKNDFVVAGKFTSLDGVNTRFQLLDLATNTLKEVKYYTDGSNRKILYID